MIMIKPVVYSLAYLEFYQVVQGTKDCSPGIRAGVWGRRRKAI